MGAINRDVDSPRNRMHGYILAGAFSGIGDAEDSVGGISLPSYTRLSRSLHAQREVDEIELEIPRRPRRPPEKGVAWKLADFLGSWRGRKLGRKGAEARESVQEKIEEERKPRPSWMPDPDRRWPLQGW